MGWTARPIRFAAIGMIAAAVIAGSVPAAAPAPARPVGLSGLVLDPAGRALAGVKVLLSTDGFITTLAAGITDITGQFRIEPAPGGRFQLAAVKEGYRVRITSIDTLLRASLDMVLQPLPDSLATRRPPPLSNLNWILRVPPGDILRDTDAPVTMVEVVPAPSSASIPNQIHGEFVHLETGGGPGAAAQVDAGGRSSRLSMGGEVGDRLEWRFLGDLNRLTNDTSASTDTAGRDLDSRALEMGFAFNPTADDDVSVSVMFGKNQFRRDASFPDPFSPATDQQQQAWGYDARWSRALDPLSHLDLRLGYLKGRLWLDNSFPAAVPAASGAPIDQNRWEAGGRYRVDLDDNHRLVVGMNTRVYRSGADAAGDFAGGMVFPGFGQSFGPADTLEGWDLDLYGQNEWTLSDPVQIISSLAYSRTDPQRRDEVLIPKVTIRHLLANGTVWDAGLLVAWNPGSNGGPDPDRTIERDEEAGVGYELGFRRPLPAGFHVRVKASQHPARGYDELLHGDLAFAAAPPAVGADLYLGARRVMTREIDFEVEKRFRHAVGRLGSVVGEAEGRLAAGLGAFAPIVSLTPGSMRYLETRVHTVLDRSETEFRIGYKRISEQTDFTGVNPAGSRSYSIIDLAVAQRLAFLENLSRSQWRVILAYQDVTTETGPAPTGEPQLPPTSTWSRVSGGIEIRF